VPLLLLLRSAPEACGAEAEYYKMELGACCCPAGGTIASPDDCAAALDSLGLVRMQQWTGTLNMVPSGCAWRSPHGGEATMHLNYDTRGRGRFDLSPVCKRAQAAPAAAAAPVAAAAAAVPAAVMEGAGGPGRDFSAAEVLFGAYVPQVLLIVAGLNVVLLIAIVLHEEPLKFRFTSASDFCKIACPMPGQVLCLGFVAVLLMHELSRCEGLLLASGDVVLPHFLGTRAAKSENKFVAPKSHSLEDLKLAAPGPAKSEIKFVAPEFHSLENLKLAAPGPAKSEVQLAAPGTTSTTKVWTPPATTTPVWMQGCDWQCYLDRYADVKQRLGTNLEAAEAHYYTLGRKEGRDCTCSR